MDESTKKEWDQVCEREAGKLAEQDVDFADLIESVITRHVDRAADLMVVKAAAEDDPESYTISDTIDATEAFGFALAKVRPLIAAMGKMIETELDQSPDKARVIRLLAEDFSD